MNSLLLILTFTIMGTSVWPLPTAAQIPPPAKRATHVKVTDGPELESAKDSLAIIRWTITNPGGSDEHFGVVYYGTDAKNLSETAKSHIRLNPTHSYTVFRVRVENLKPRTRYYYTVDSMEPNGRGDGVTSPINAFTTP